MARCVHCDLKLRASELVCRICHQSTIMPLPRRHRRPRPGAGTVLLILIMATGLYAVVMYVAATHQ